MYTLPSMPETNTYTSDIPSDGFANNIQNGIYKRSQRTDTITSCKNVYFNPYISYYSRAWLNTISELSTAKKLA